MLNIILLVLFFCTTFSYAGDKIGNGGGAWVCRNAHDKKINYIETYDLYESKILFKKNILESTDAYEIQVKKALDKFKKSSFRITLEDADIFLKLSRGENSIPSDFSLNDIGDLGDVGEIIKKENCKVEFIFNYTDEGDIYFNKVLFDLLSETSKAAIITHEVIYKYLRKVDKVETSRRARRINAQLYTDFEPNMKRQNFVSTLISKNQNKISAEITRFGEFYRIYFYKLYNRNIPWHEYVEIPTSFFNRSSCYFKKYSTITTFGAACQTRYIKVKSMSDVEAGINLTIIFHTDENSIYIESDEFGRVIVVLM